MMIEKNNVDSTQDSRWWGSHSSSGDLQRRQDQGLALPIILVLMLVITIMGVSTLKTGNFQATMANNSRAIQLVDQTAETAIDTVIESVINEDDCISFNKMMKQAITDEIEDGGLTTTAANNGGVSNLIDQAGGVGLDIQGQTTSACIGNALIDVAGRGIEAMTDTRFCGPVAGVAGFEMGSFVNLKFETRGIAQMPNTNADTQNVQLWVHMGVDSKEMQPAKKDCI